MPSLQGMSKLSTTTVTTTITTKITTTTTTKSENTTVKTMVGGVIHHWVIKTSKRLMLDALQTFSVYVLQNFTGSSSIESLLTQHNEMRQEI
jgi:hypothetical protein